MFFDISLKSRQTKDLVEGCVRRVTPYGIVSVCETAPFFGFPIGYDFSSGEFILALLRGAVMLRISLWVSIALLVLETAFVGTVARAQTGLSDQRFSWAPGGNGSVYNWTGFYIGAKGGGAWAPDRNIVVNETFNNTPVFDGAFGTRSVQGGFGGAQLGYRSQHGPWVFGGEFDAMGGSISGRSREIFTPYFSAGNSITIRTDECVDFFSTLTGRVGYAFDRALIYAIGGGAVANTNLRINMMDTFGFDAAARSKGLRGGFVAGAGVEYGFNGNWSVRAEYQYIDLGNALISAREFTGNVPSAFNIYNSTRINYNTFEVGVNYRFDGTGTTALVSLTGN
jgi:outer membrane immunogenic protein